MKYSAKQWKSIVMSSNDWGLPLTGVEICSPKNGSSKLSGLNIFQFSYGFPFFFLLFSFLSSQLTSDNNRLSLKKNCDDLLVFIDCWSRILTWLILPNNDIKHPFSKPLACDHALSFYLCSKEAEKKNNAWSQVTKTLTTSSFAFKFLLSFAFSEPILSFC